MPINIFNSDFIYNIYPILRPLSYCVTSVAWQTHRDHVVRSRRQRRSRWCPRRWCRRHTFRFCSITFEGMYWFHSNFAEHYITIKYKSSLILVVICQIFAELRPFINLVFVVRFHSITFDFIQTLQRTLYHCKIQVKFDIGNHMPNFGSVMALFRLGFCWCVDIGFRSITFAEMHWFYWKFAEGYINVKYRSRSILVIICKILAELWSFFYLVFVGVLILVSTQ